jgi:hypothetical protein
MVIWEGSMTIKPKLVDWKEVNQLPILDYNAFFWQETKSYLYITVTRKNDFQNYQKKKIAR